MASAQEHLAKGDRQAAVIQLKNLLQQAPNDGAARLMLGQALFEAEDFVSAEKEFSRALELKQPHEKVVPPYVQSLLALRKYQAVVTEVGKYKLFNPAAVATTQTALGDAYMRLGNSAQAREAYTTATAAVAGYPRARLGEAMLTAIEGRTDDALKQLDEVIAVEPKLAEAHAYRADILLAKGDRQGAMKALQEAIAADNRYVPARLTLIGMLTDDRDFEGAAKLIESTRKIAPGDLRVTYHDARLAFRRDELERARQQVQQVLKHLPEHLPALLLAGSIEIKGKQFAAAETNLRKVVARAPNHIGARQLLAQTYLQMGQPAKARDALQPLVDRGLPDVPALQLLAGETYLANGDLKRATAFYQAAAKSSAAPRVAARTRLGQIALASGRSDEGFAELEAASDLDAGSYQADLALIVGHLRRKEFAKALEAVKALEKKQPTNPVTFQMYGAVNLAKRDLDAARKNFEQALELQPNYSPSAYSLAQIDMMQNKPDDARKRYEAMIAKEPANERLLIDLAEFQTRTGASANDVVATLKRAVQANPQSPAARVALVTTLLRAGDAKVALSSAQDALAVLPSDPGVLEVGGLAQESVGEINQAIGTYNKLASLQAQSPRPLYRLAALYLRQKDTDKAIESLRRVQKIAPRERNVVPQLVEVYIAAGRHDDALREARGLQKREPKFAGGWSLEGDVFWSQRKNADAERLYREALRVEPQANAVAVKLHAALVAGGKTAEANAWSRKWLAENPKDVLMRSYLGDRERMAKNLKVAAAHYRSVIEIEPNDAVALNNLAWIGGELGDEKALSYAERALKIAPRNSAVLDTYGMLLVKQGEFDRGLRYLSLVRQIAPANNEYRLNYAKALVKAGKKDEARSELEALSNADENFAGKDEVPDLLNKL